MTEFIHSTAIINQPAVIGKNVEIREFSVICGTPLEFKNFKREEAKFGVEIGNDVYIGPHSVIMSGVTRPTKIGNQVIIGQYTDIGHDCIIGNRTEIISTFVSGFVEIGDDTVIHAGSTIRNRIRIGKNTIIGQGSNVVKDIPDNVVAYGNPCTVISKKPEGVNLFIKNTSKKIRRLI